MEHKVLLLDDYLALLWRHKISIIISFLLSIGGAASLYIVTPKLYKAFTTVSIQSAFFSAPLASEFLPSIQDPTEVNAERSSLLETALSDTFIDNIGEKYGVYKTRPNTSARGIERALLRNNIETFRSGSGYQISINSEDANKAFEMTKEVLDHILKTIAEYRSDQLLTAERVVEERVDLLKEVLSSAGDEEAKKRVQTALYELRAKIAGLKSRFTEQHPKVIAARAKEQELVFATQKLSPTKTIHVPKGFSVDVVHPGGPTNLGLYAELVNILSKLKILIAMEKGNAVPSHVSIVTPPQIPLVPFKPQKERFLGLGVLGGLVLSALSVFFFEQRKIPLEILDDGEILHLLKAPLLGELPVLRSNKTRIQNSGMLPALQKSTDTTKSPLLRKNLF
jgi:LPS O-antigen subunit length determinant protein (WzzB/FepE family)